MGPGSGTGTVLQFLTRLRRHASLDGASPYFKVKKWKLEPSQRAASLDTRGELWHLVESGPCGLGGSCQGLPWTSRSRRLWAGWGANALGPGPAQSASGHPA